jgi:hypothetical protein
MSSLDDFNSMGALGVVWAAIAFHLVWFCMEAFAAFRSDARFR